MNSIGIIIQIIAAVGIPVFANWFHRRSKIGFLSPIVICYGLGILLGNLPFLPMDAGLNETLSELTVPLAIPLLLLSTDLKAFLRTAGKTTLAFGLSLVAVMVAAGFSAYLFSDGTRESAEMASMLVGVYTGGTPNMAAIKLAIQASDESFALLNLTDLICSGIYLVFLTSIAHKVLGWILPSYQPKGTASQQAVEEQGFKGMPMQRVLLNLLLLTLVGVVILAASAGATWLIAGELALAVLILFLTAFGILASLIPPLRQMRGGYEYGQFLLLIFSTVMGMRSNFAELAAGSGTALAFTAVLFALAVILHILLAWLFRVDRDTLMITSTASIFGPVFIGQVALAIGNRELVFPGIAAGLVGYAVGNFLGIGLFSLLT
jgi:uncharacterized membrane protein